MSGPSLSCFLQSVASLNSSRVATAELNVYPYIIPGVNIWRISSVLTLFTPIMSEVEWEAAGQGCQHVSRAVLECAGELEKVGCCC